jgi:lipid-binding SYLF domain-containing protein
MASVASAVCCVGVLVGGACSTEPKAQDQADFLARARSSTTQFERSVNGLDEQIQHSAGYVIFPDVAQWGILFGGGTYGRGALFRPDGSQVGWAALNTGSIGLQAGVQGFRMLMVIQDEPTLRKFMDNQLTGSATGVLVGGEHGGSGTAPFQNGVAVYQGANRGLMAGVNIGLNYVRYKPLGEENAK